MRSYIEMSAQDRVPERFIQVSCAVGLHREHRRLVTIETSRSSLKEYFPKSTSRIDSIPLHIANAGFKVDLLVYDPVGDDPDNAPLRAIVEFKNAMGGVDSDISRTAELLSALRDEAPPTEGTRFGWQALCVVYYNRDEVQSDIGNMKVLSNKPGVCAPQWRVFPVERASRPRLYCGVVGLFVSGDLGTPA